MIFGPSYTVKSGDGPAPLSALHYCLVKKVMYHSRATFKEVLKQVICFSK